MLLEVASGMEFTDRATQLYYLIRNGEAYKAYQKLLLWREDFYKYFSTILFDNSC